jgi:hypothetical protein
MSVYLVVEWIDGIPETIKIYEDPEAAQQFVEVLGRPHMTVQKWEVH